MPRISGRLLIWPLLLLVACRVEHQVPPGQVQDEEAIRATLLGYFRGLAAGDSAAVRSVLADSMRGLIEDGGRWRMVTGARNWQAAAWSQAGAARTEPTRMDIRQEGDLASAWLTVRAGGGMTHVLLSRTDGTWHILSLATVSAAPDR